MRRRLAPSSRHIAFAALAVVAASGLFFAVAYAIGLTITSPYFTLTFGLVRTPLADAQANSSTSPTPLLPATPEVSVFDLTPTQPIPAPDSTCLPALVCVTVEADLDRSQPDGPDAQVEADLAADRVLDIDLGGGEDGLSLELLGIQVTLGSGGLGLGLP